jgi:hypothetical protein
VADIPSSGKQYSFSFNMALDQEQTSASAMNAFPSRQQVNNSAVSSPTEAKNAKQKRPVLTTDRLDRTSFSSIKESNSGVAQSFTDSKTSSYLRHELLSPGAEEAIFDDTSSGSRTPEEGATGAQRLGGGMLTNPQSLLHGFVCPCDGFRGWKGISIKGKVASKSFGDLRALGRWDWDVTDEKSSARVEEMEGVEIQVKKGKVDPKTLPGQSPLESLPMELLGKFLSTFATENYGREFWVQQWPESSMTNVTISSHDNLRNSLRAPIHDFY